MTKEQKKQLKYLQNLQYKETEEERKREELENIKNIKRFKRHQEIDITTNELGSIQFAISANTRLDHKGNFLTITPLESVRMAKTEYKLLLVQYADNPNLFLVFKNKSSGQMHVDLKVDSWEVIDLQEFKG